MREIPKKEPIDPDDDPEIMDADHDVLREMQPLVEEYVYAEHRGTLTKERGKEIKNKFEELYKKFRGRMIKEYVTFEFMRNIYIKEYIEKE